MTYIFFRKEGWYPVEIDDPNEIAKHVELNPGTLRVETFDGELVFESKETPQ